MEKSQKTAQPTEKRERHFMQIKKDYEWAITCQSDHKKNLACHCPEYC